MNLTGNTLLASLLSNYLKPGMATLANNVTIITDMAWLIQSPNLPKTQIPYIWGGGTKKKFSVLIICIKLNLVLSRNGGGSGLGVEMSLRKICWS